MREERRKRKRTLPAEPPRYAPGAVVSFLGVVSTFSPFNSLVTMNIFAESDLSNGVAVRSSSGNDPGWR